MSDIERKILDALAGDSALTTAEIHNLFHRNTARLGDTLRDMESRGLIASIVVQTKGRPCFLWELAETQAECGGQMTAVDTAEAQPSLGTQQDKIDLLNGRCERLEKELSEHSNAVDRAMKRIGQYTSWHPAAPAGLCSERGIEVLRECAAEVATLLALTIEKAETWRAAKAALAVIAAAAEGE